MADQMRLTIKGEDTLVLEAQNRSLENELRAARKALRDDYAQAALTGLLAYGYSPRDLVVEEAFRVADRALEERGK